MQSIFVQNVSQGQNLIATVELLKAQTPPEHLELWTDKNIHDFLRVQLSKLRSGGG